jgi:hypothetical protein
VRSNLPDIPVSLKTARPRTWASSRARMAVVPGRGGVDGGAVDLGRLEFLAALSNDQAVGGELARLLVRGQLEPVREHTPSVP